MGTVSEQAPQGVMSSAAEQRIAVISCDSHVAPAVSEFRPFCEAAYLEPFNEFVSAIEDHLLAAPNSDGSESSARSQSYWDRFY
jgi:hypothetical protein